jgi:ComF family protein
MTRAEQLKGATLDLLFPPRCLGCGDWDSFLCPRCKESLPKLKPPYCTLCGAPLDRGNLCPQCAEKPLAIDGIRSPFLYQGLVRDAIHSLKYGRLKALAQPLSQLLFEYLSSHPLPADTLLPVPLHPKRIRERGYNQSSLLARELGRLIHLPVIENSLFRLRNTPPQVRLTSAEERHANVQGAFECKGQELYGKHILLIDDVCTTGATLNACALALKGAGVISVWGLTLARE